MFVSAAGRPDSVEAEIGIASGLVDLSLDFVPRSQWI
jgi:hypothetical protein